MIKPTIHNNGTSPETLMMDLEAVARSLYAAIKALENANPNGRDYYPQGDQAIHTAIQQQAERINRVKKTLDEIKELMEHVADHE